MRIPIVLAIFRKDVVDAMRDSRVLVSLLTPLLLAILYNSIFPEERLFEAKVAYAGPETSALVRTLQERAGQTVSLEAAACRYRGGGSSLSSRAKRSMRLSSCPPTSMRRSVRAGVRRSP